MTVDVSNEPPPAITDGEPAPVAPPRRSLWRVSLGGALLFAAGAMVGFAPMRAWVFLRDEPKVVTISAVILEADANEVAGIREALKAHAADEQTRNLDPLTILESRPGTKTLARPTLQTTVGESATFFSGGELVLPGSGADTQTRPFGFEATFEPEIRPSGNIELSYRLSDRRAPKIAEALFDEQTGSVLEVDEESVESTVVLRPDVWEAIEWDTWTSPSPGRNRVRWIFLKVHPDE